MKKVSIVVPLHNERESLPLLIKAISEVLTPMDIEYEIVLVDDGSTDGSFDVLKQLYAQYGSCLRLFRFCRNYGNLQR